jgi:hypothetical protein
LAIPISNAYGLVLLIILMSYGLIEVPRGLWFTSSVDWKLRVLETEIPKIKELSVDAEAEAYDVAAICSLASVKIPTTDILRPKLEKILERVRNFNSVPAFYE